MPSKIDEEIKKVFQKWGKETALEFKESARDALAKGGRTNPQTVSLEFKELIVTTEDGNVGLEIRAQKLGKPAKYWKVIEEGRAANKKAPPSDVFGRTWQNEQNIDARVVLLEIQRKKKGIVNVNRKFKRLKKTLDYDKAVKTLSFLIARSIGKKGIKPKPFVGKVLNDGRITELREMLTPLLGEKFKLIIKGLE